MLMYGTIKAISERLFHAYGGDEPLAVLIWDRPAIADIGRDDHVTDEEVLTVLEYIGSLPISLYRDAGINREGVEEMIYETIARRRRSVTVDAGMLESVLHLAASVLDSNTPEDMDAETRSGHLAIAVLVKVLHTCRPPPGGRQYSGG
uniref:DUF1380 family protein n=1 Tax=Sodalis glossinidius TaxID=63612 RepID=UPI001F5B31DC|nr:DUF1380 family protein [Sodalis glossinidius]